MALALWSGLVSRIHATANSHRRGASCLCNLRTMEGSKIVWPTSVVNRLKRCYSNPSNFPYARLFQYEGAI